jgi:hypothetical protein
VEPQHDPRPLPQLHRLGPPAPPLEITKKVADPKARGEVNPLLRRLGVWIGLPFTSVAKGKKRLVQRLQSGMMTFGERGLPVPLFGVDNMDAHPNGKAPETNQGSDRPWQDAASHSVANRDVVCGECREASLKGLAAGTRDGLQTSIIGEAPAAAARSRIRSKDQLELDALMKYKCCWYMAHSKRCCGLSGCDAKQRK